MSKGTPRRSVRIPDEVWNEALALATGRGDNLSDILRQRLVEYIEIESVKLPRIGWDVDGTMSHENERDKG